MLAPEQEEKIINALIQGKRIVDLHPKQAEVYDAEERVRVVCAGSGFGKTMLGILIAIKTAFQKPGTTSVIISPTDDQGKRNVPDTFKQIWDLLKTYDKYFKQFNTPEADAEFFADGVIIFKVPYKNKFGVTKLLKTKILLLSGHNADRIRGLRIDGVFVLDELSYIENNEKLWMTIVGRKSGKPKIFAISTPPDNHDLLYKLIQQGKEYNDDGTKNNDKKDDFKSWIFRTIDNPTDENIKTLVKEAKEELTKEQFEREFEGKFENIGSGNLCKQFSRERNLVEWKMFSNHPICFSSDFNVGCWTTIAFQILTKEEIKEKVLDKGLIINNHIQYENLQDEVMFVFKEWKLAGVDTLVPEFCEIATNYLLEIGYNANELGVSWFGDPHGIQKNVNSKRMANGRIANSWDTISLYFPDVQLYNDKFEEQLDRVENFNAKVRNYLGKTGILINKDCEELIKDIEKIRKTPDGKGIDKTREKKPLFLGHLFDCISYAVSYQWEVNPVTPEIYFV
ncbi:MAG: terminase family protein [Ignavibacteria bacterium]|nr:terminase family protein [Ignavibacteria bacterium]